MALPKLTAEERAANLAKAALARQKRAEVRQALKDGKLSISEVLVKTDDPIVGRMKVSALLESLPGFGKAKAMRLMEQLDISETRRVQGLGSRQLADLKKALS